MNAADALATLKDDRDVVEPFVNRLLLRVRAKHPGEDIRLEDISIRIEVRLLNGSAQAIRMLGDMIKEGVSI